MERAKQIMQVARWFASSIGIRPEANYIHHSSSPTMLSQSCPSLNSSQTTRADLFQQHNAVFWVPTAQIQSSESKEVSNYNYHTGTDKTIW